MSSAFENWKAVNGESRQFGLCGRTRLHQRMEKERKEKVRSPGVEARAVNQGKRKKGRKEGEPSEEQSSEGREGGGGGWKGGERGRSTPEGFYIAHPRSMKRTAHFKDVHSRKLAELLEAFHMFDFDRDGAINAEDLRKSFASLCMEVEEEEVQQMLSEGLSPLNFDAFVILLGYRTLDLDPEEVLLDALSNWDDHDCGLISYDRLRQHIMAWGDKFTEEEAVSALADAPIVLDKTKEKMIDYIQFSEDLCGLRKMMQRRTNEDGN